MPATETVRAEYERLNSEHRSLLRLDNPTAEQTVRRDIVRARLLEIVAAPPAGYSTPPAALRLVEHARAHGWEVVAQWNPPGSDVEPQHHVEVGRVMRPGEVPDARGDSWRFRLTWHSRGCPPGRVRLFGRGCAITPTRPVWADAPSLKAIHAVICAHPA